jgi:hypothetical protein
MYWLCYVRWDKPTAEVANAIEARIEEEKRHIDEAVEVINDLKDNIITTLY